MSSKRFVPAVRCAGLTRVAGSTTQTFELSSQLNLKIGILNRQAHRGCPPVRAAAEPAGIDANLLSKLG